MRKTEKSSPNNPQANKKALKGPGNRFLTLNS